MSKRLDSLSFNLANASSPGFLADGLRFDSIVSTTGGARVAYPHAGADYIVLAHGARQRTGNPNDVAARGDAWLALSTPQGVAYTRDGRLQIDSNGSVRSVNGYPFLDSGGAPLVVDPAGGEISVATDGAISQRGRVVGAIGLFALDPQAQLTRQDNSSVLSNIEATPISDFSRSGLMQGFVEQSNVNPLTEITRLIEIQRAFDHISACMSIGDTSQQESIRTLGAQS